MVSLESNRSKNFDSVEKFRLVENRLKELYIRTNSFCETKGLALLRRATALESFLHWALMCSFHFNSSSIIIPKTSFCLTCSISVSLISIWRPSGIRFNFLFEAISIYLVFLVFNVNLLASSHLLKLRKSEFSLYSISAVDTPEHVKFVSSANIYA